MTPTGAYSNLFPIILRMRSNWPVCAPQGNRNLGMSIRLRRFLMGGDFSFNICIIHTLVKMATIFFLEYGAGVKPTCNSFADCILIARTPVHHKGAISHMLSLGIHLEGGASLTWLPTKFTLLCQSLVTLY